MTATGETTPVPKGEGVDRLTVQRETYVAAPADRVWEYLTTARRLSRWFADVRGVESLTPGATFRLEFGDGDFFAGRVLGARAPGRLAFEWRFMGVGPRYAIEFTLSAVPAHTRVVVTDRGAISWEEAEELDEGWADFLARLVRAVEHGAHTRYEWSERIGAAAIVDASPAEVMEELTAPSWWAAQGPPQRFRVERSADDSVVLVLHGDPEEREHATEASVCVTPFAGRTHLRVSHVGWDRLPAATRVGERRRAATWWAAVLRRLERERR